ncbi:hypothetical protein COV17_03600 [Candidatus Woesearchaeota archaeon CG10_big_fil_rev_8_21_14_0_10_36_11]|nr:MAG: hypothetical protein COV17_03600 [Candidatus Woesearchaeota archaeon CG10_big_fil_rev_8_21_14_0_10_36_11]
MVLRNVATSLASLALIGSLAFANPARFAIVQPPRHVSSLSQFCGSTLERVVEAGITAGIQPETILTSGIIPQNVHIVSRITGGEDVAATCADQKPKYATIDDTVEMYVVLEATRFGQKVYFTDAPCIKLQGKRKADRVMSWPSSKKPDVEWFKVEAEGNSYGYISKRHPILYEETSWRDGWKTSADVHPTSFEDLFLEKPSGIGVMRFKVVARLNGREMASSGSESIKHGAISTKVHRVSFRPDTGSWTDYLFELFNTPYIWASTTSQVDSLIGSDCADFATYGWRRYGHENPYTWSYGLRNKKHTTRIAQISDTNTRGILLDNGGNPVPYGTVNEGDVVFFPRHIAVLYEDNGNGVLDCSDLVLHTLFHEPTIVPLCEAFGVPKEILRWKELLTSK